MSTYEQRQQQANFIKACNEILGDGEKVIKTKTAKTGNYFVKFTLGEVCCYYKFFDTNSHNWGEFKIEWAIISILASEKIDGVAEYKIIEDVEKKINYFTVPHYQDIFSGGRKNLIEGEEAKLKLVKGIATCLCKLKEKGIEHGDISVGNVLVDNNYNFKIIDFDTSKLNRSGKVTNTDPEGLSVFCDNAFKGLKSEELSNEILKQQKLLQRNNNENINSKVQNTSL